MNDLIKILIQLKLFLLKLSKLGSKTTLSLESK